MGIIGEMRAVPQTWDEYLYGLLAGPMESIGQWGTENQTPVTGGWQAPFQVIADAAPFLARGVGQWGEQLREASEGAPLTSDAGGFPPDSPLAFLNQRINERGAAVLDATTGILAPAATRTGKALAETAKAIPDIAMDAYGPQRSASWIFGGMGAKTADTDMLARAFELEQGRAAPEDIWKQTGWFRAPWDNQWRFEIDDSRAVFDVGALDAARRKQRDLRIAGQVDNDPLTARGLLAHEDLYAAYPELGDIPVQIGNGSSFMADVGDGTGRIKLDSISGGKSPLSHELEHGVQNQEGFSTGGSRLGIAARYPEALWQRTQEKLSFTPADAADYRAKLADMMPDLSAKELDAAVAKQARLVEQARNDPTNWLNKAAQETASFEMYQRLPGEAEARLVQRRLPLTAEERRASFPLNDLRGMLSEEKLGVVTDLQTRERLAALGQDNGAGILDRVAESATAPGDGILRKHVTLVEQDGGILGKTTAETPHDYPAKMGKWPLRSDQGDLNVPTSYRPDKFTGLTPEAQSFIKQFKTDDFRNKTAVHYNEKTGLSLDFSTSCTKRSGGGCNAGACAYCYVEHDRSAKKAGMGTPTSPKKLVENDYEDEILRMPADLVTNLNRDGGLRMFSFGDFRPGIDDDNVARALADAQQRGLYIKAITKEPALIERFGDHPNFRANLSIDYLPREASNSFTIDDALALKAGRDNIKLRGVALNMEEAERMAADPRIDVITLYHGPTGDRLYKIVAEQNPKLVEKFGGEEALRAELGRWQNMSPRNGAVKEFMERNAGRVCCQGGKCSTDPHTKCGFASKAVGALLPGVAVPAWFDEEGTPEYF